MTKTLLDIQLNTQLLHKISDAIIGFENNGEVLFKNQTAFDIFGDFKNFWDFFDLDQKSTFTKNSSFKHQYLKKDLSISIEKSKNQFIALIKIESSFLEENKIQSAYYQIGNLSKTTKNLNDLLEKIHLLLIEKMQANNMMVCLDNKENDTLDFIYYADEESGGKIESYSRKKANGLPEYVLNNKEASLLYEEDILKLKKEGLLEPIGKIPKIWIGVPMLHNDKYFGVLAVKSHSNRNKFNSKDLEFLKFITIQISFGIERKIYEDKITDQTAQLQAIFESGNHLIWSVNKKRQLTSFNENYAKVINQLHGVFPKLEDIENNVLLLSNIETDEEIENKYLLAFKGLPQIYETSFKENDDITTWRQIFLSPIYSKSGKINQVSGIAHDITDRKLIELQITENEKKFRHIFETLQDIYIRINGRDEIEIISPSVEFITGFEPRELIGKNVRDFFKPKNKGDLDILQNMMHEDKSIKNFELNLITKTGELIPSIANLDAVLNNHNKTIGVQGVIRDIYELQTITEELKKAKTEAERSLKVKENFLANMSHEIRTPMNGIVAMIDMLQGTRLTGQQKEYINTIQESSHILMKILNDILDLSKLEAGKMELRQEKVNVKDILQKTFLLFSQRAKMKSITFNFYSDPNIPKSIISDETRLIQILLNLTSNAIKFTDNKGEVSITAKLVEDFEHWCSIKFEIKDSGIGIEEKEINNLFQSFNQVDSSITKKYGGTGLGLSISKELCSLMGGTIEVKSKKNVGSSFYFTINASKTFEKNPTIHLGIIDKKERRNLKNLRVLVVDDIEINRKVCRLLLEEEKASVVLATNGNEALNLIHSNRFDIVLMDIQMPIMDGVSAFKAIKLMPAAKNTKIIAITAFSMENDREKYLKIGFDNYLSKPITKDKLIQAILDKADLSTAKTISFNTVPFINFEQQQSIEKIGGRKLFLEILEDFRLESDDVIDHLKKSIKIKNYLEIHDLAHSLKGSSGSVGLSKYAQIAHNIEQESKNKKEAMSQSLFEDIFKEHETFVTWLKKEQLK